MSKHLAGSHRIFSHSLFERPASSLSSPSLASANQSTNLNPSNLNPYVGKSINISASPTINSITGGASESLNASAHLPSISNHSFSADANLGPSGAVSDPIR